MKLPVKRSREEEEAYTADCLMLLSKVGRSEAGAAGPAGRSFTCKTCNKEFMSFQALGGHRASHNKPDKLARVDGLSLKTTLTSSPAKRKSHECPVCGIEFAIGQALGGHMRRHRATGVKNTNDDAKNIVYPTSTSSTTTNTSSSTVSDELEPRVVKKSRFMIFGVDLSLVKPEKDVKLELGLAGRESPALMGLLV